MKYYETDHYEILEKVNYYSIRYLKLRLNGWYIIERENALVTLARKK